MENSRGKSHGFVRLSIAIIVISAQPCAQMYPRRRYLEYGSNIPQVALHNNNESAKAHEISQTYGQVRCDAA